MSRRSSRPLSSSRLLGSYPRVLVGALIVIAGCGGGSSTQPGERAGGGATAGSGAAGGSGPTTTVVQKTLTEIGLDPAALDRTADPCEDFYQFACGGWMASTEIPADKPLAMRSFVDIGDRNEAFLKEMLDRAATEPGDDPVMRGVGTYYGACLDEATIAKAGTTPLRELEQLIRPRNPATLARAVAALHGVGAGALFEFGSLQDAHDATLVIGGIDQGGLGLPEREYYLNTDEQSVKLREAYLAYIADILELGGTPKATAARGAATVLRVETEIAKVSLDKVARRDPVKTYNRIDGQLATLMPHFDWPAYWKGLGIAPPTQLTVNSLPYLQGLDALLKRTSLADWQVYFEYHLLSGKASILGKGFADAQFKFSSKLTGAQEQPPRWKRCVAMTDGLLGDWVSQIFVKDRFPGASKDAALGQVHAITAAMAANLDLLPWMDPETKTRAKAKLSAMSYQIGFPNKWKVYDFAVTKDFAKTSLAAARFEVMRDLGKIGKPLDRDDWGLTASDVNAYYTPQLNGMVFPAGILQPPFFSVTSSATVNLGAIGVVVGHELTHGFDDQGAQYDDKGNLRVWWEAATQAEFKSRTQCVIDQYSGYEVLPGVKVNGETTVGENIADIGGVKLALAASRSVREQDKAAVVADGFTEDQQFFLGFAQAWCAKLRPDFATMLVNVDEHSPAQWRVNGSLQATPAFAQAWACKAGQRMKPAKVCEVW